MDYRIVAESGETGIMAFSGQAPAGVHYVDLGAMQNGVRTFLHVNLFTGGGTVQFVFSADAASWTSYDPDTELTGTSTALPASFTAMGFDSPGARYVGVRNTSAMDANVLLWAYGI